MYVTYPTKSTKIENLVLYYVKLLSNYKINLMIYHCEYKYPGTSMQKFYKIIERSEEAIKAICF